MKPSTPQCCEKCYHDGFDRTMPSYCTNLQCECHTARYGDTRCCKECFLPERDGAHFHSEAAGYALPEGCKDEECDCHIRPTTGACERLGNKDVGFSDTNIESQPTTETNFSLVEKHMQDVGDKTFNPTTGDVEYRFLKWAEGVDLDMYTARMSLEYFLTEISQARIEERLRIVSIAEGMKKPEDLIINKETLHLIKLYNAALSELLKAINE